jgi:gentisate 1,2-dioxygenase
VTIPRRAGRPGAAILVGMAIDAHESPAPVVAVGEATEDWTGDARFHEYSTAADPIGSGAISPVPVERFSPTVHEGPGTRLIPLDLSGALDVPYPATSPALLAAFVVLEPGGSLVTTPDATSELYYCLEGAGSTRFTRASLLAEAAGPAPDGGTIAWGRGDFVTLPAGCTCEHRAGPAERALLYRVTDAPLLAYLGVTPGPARFAPTRYAAAASLARLAEVEAHPDAASRSRVSILLGNAAQPQTLTVTPTLWAMLGVLPADRVQRPHRHQSVALDLITDCAPGCFTLVGTSLDDRGEIADPIRVDWQGAGAFDTPPGMWHSHHNESGRPAHLVPIQDAGLHTYLRSLDIRFGSSAG